MFTKKQAPEPEGLDKVIADAIEELHSMNADSPEYARVVEQLEKLNKIANSNKRDKLSPDAVAGIVANLGGILLILSHEQTHAIATKALGFVAKLKP